MNPSDMRKWKKGDGFSSAHLNQPVDYLRGVGQIKGAKTSFGMGIDVQSGNGATTISLVGGTLTGRWFWGKVAGTGPNSEADYADARYWMKAQYMKATGDDTLKPDFQDATSVFGSAKTTTSGTQYFNVVTAVNIAEMAALTHTMATGEYVQVFEVREEPQDYDPTGVDTTATKPDKQAVVRWVFYSGGALPTGQYQFMLFGNVTQNQTGFDFVRGHGTL